MSPQQKQKAWKVLEILNWSAEHLREKGLENPRLTAELLVGYALQLNRIDLYLQFDRSLTPDEIARYKQALQRRLRHVPVQYILGRTEFYSLSFVVNESVFIPRPETEVLVETALKRLAGLEGDLLAADIGTGCGAVAIALAHQLPKATVYGTDCCARALEVAKGNALSHGLAERVVLLKGDLLAPLEGVVNADGAPLRFDAIVSNPPYVRTDDIRALPDEVRRYEPQVALDGGPDGLDFHRRLAEEAPAFLRTGGLLFLEVGDGQGQAVAECLEQSRCFGEVQRVRDLSGTERVVIAEKADA